MLTAVILTELNTCHFSHHVWLHQCNSMLPKFNVSLRAQQLSARSFRILSRLEKQLIIALLCAHICFVLHGQDMLTSRAFFHLCSIVSTCLTKPVKADSRSPPAPMQQIQLYIHYKLFLHTKTITIQGKL